MNFKKILIICLVFSFHSSYSQQAREQYDDIKDEMMGKYYNKQYQQALIQFQKILQFKQLVNASDYYNGACIAALAAKKKEAYSYLGMAIDKGWLDTLHMQKDEDLNLLKNSQGWILLQNKLRVKYEKLLTALAPLFLVDYSEVIPYTINNKWGWMNKTSLKPICHALFDYTDFKVGNNFLFSLGGITYGISGNAAIFRILKEKESDIAVMSRDDSPALITDTSFYGFKESNGVLQGYSDRYLSVELFKIMKNRITFYYSIVEKKNGLCGIIDSNGNVLPNFDFNFSELKFISGLNESFIISKRKSDLFYELRNLSGEKINAPPFDDYALFSTYQPYETGSGSWFYVGAESFKYLKLTYKRKHNVLRMSTQEQIFKKWYNTILRINGPTEDDDRTGNANNKGIGESYFLVIDKGQKFYVDKNGVEYRIR